MRYINGLPISIITQIPTLGGVNTAAFSPLWGNEYTVDASTNSITLFLPQPLSANLGEIITINRIDNNSANEVIIIASLAVFANVNISTCNQLSLGVGSTTTFRSTGTQVQIKNFNGISALLKTWSPDIGTIGATVKRTFNARDLNGLENGNAGFTDGQLIDTWSDLSGFGLNATQANNANKPTYRATGINGTAAIEATDNNSFMSAGNYSSDSGTMVALVRTGASLANVEKIFGPDVNNGQLAFIHHSSGVEWVHSGTSLMPSATTLATTNTTYIRSATFDDVATTNNVKYRLNGADDGTQSYAGDVGGAAATFQLFRQASDLTNAGTRIGILVFCDSVLSQSNLEKVEGFAAWQYGLSTTLPVSHPYRYHPPTVALRAF